MLIAAFIFLDVDGVLNANFQTDAHQKEISDGALIDREKVALLGRLARGTGAKIVLHSGWRFWFDDRLQPIRQEAAMLADWLHAEGMEIFDVTPDFTTEEIRRTRKFSLVKAKEILGWLAEHPETDGWVVLDDLDLHDAIVAAHQIRTDPAVGLTEQDIKRAKELLK